MALIVFLFPFGAAEVMAIAWVTLFFLDRAISVVRGYLEEGLGYWEEILSMDSK